MASEWPNTKDVVRYLDDLKDTYKDDPDKLKQILLLIHDRIWIASERGYEPSFNNDLEKAITDAAALLKTSPRLFHGIDTLFDKGYSVECSTDVEEVEYFVFSTPEGAKILSSSNLSVPGPSTSLTIREILSSNQSLETILPESTNTSLLSCFSQLIQLELDSNQLVADGQRKALELLQNLASKFILSPSIRLDDIEPIKDYPLHGGEIADIYMGRMKNKVVCLKVLRMFPAPTEVNKKEHWLPEFAREAQIWRQLKHPNVLPFLGASEHVVTPRLSIISPWMRNGNIINYLERHSEHSRLKSIREVAEGLKYLHGLDPPIAHKDVKGANILVNDDLICCLTDFGLASIVETKRLETRDLSQTSVYWLAPELMDPDRFEGQTSGLASDIYSLACTIYEIYSGKPPFSDRKAPLKVMMAVLSGERPSLPANGGHFTIQEDIWSLVRLCWSTDPKERPSILQVQDRLKLITGFVHEENEQQPQLIPKQIARVPHPSKQRTHPERLRITEWLVQELEGNLSGAGSPEDDIRAETSAHALSNDHGIIVASSEITASAEFRSEDPSSPHPQVWSNHASIMDICEKASRIFQDRAHYKRLLSYRGRKAQLSLDLFQSVLDCPDIDDRFRPQLTKALVRLCKHSSLYPTCLTLKNVKREGKYPIAGGHFGEIWKGWFKKQCVCLKVVKLYQNSDIQKLLTAFSMEAILWSQLAHANILPFYGLYHLESENKEVSLVSPWMDNGNINDYLAQNPSVNRLLLISDVIEGIIYLHNKHMVHGDLKGANILVSNSGRACLADFGLSVVAVSDVLRWTTLPSTGPHGGTVRWQAPELIDCEDDQKVFRNEASDVYAFACVCYEIFTGHCPFVDTALDFTVMLKIVRAERPPCPPRSDVAWCEWGLSEVIWELMVDCWKHDPSDRPTAVEVRNRLRPLLDGIMDGRPGGNWDDLSTSHFRGTVHEYPTFDELENILV